jgi:lipoprotein-releasing system permease protein
MKFKTNTEIAITHLTSRVKQTVVAALGVTFGMSMYIFINGLISGTNDYFEKTTLSSIPHVRIFNDATINDESILDKYLASYDMMTVVYNQKASSESANIHNPWAILDEIKKDPRVKASTAQVNASVIYSNGSFEVNGNIFGVNILEEDKMFDIKSDMKKGKIDYLNSSNNGIIIGSGIASKLGVGLNDNITVSSSKGTSKLMKIVGIFETTVKATDQSKSLSLIHI